MPALVGAAALAVCVIGAFFDREQFFRSYLIGFLLCLGAALGSLALLMLYHLVGGRWGFLIRRLLEAACRTLPLVAVLLVPLLFGLKDLFPWAQPARTAADPLLAAKSGYLNAGFFIARAILYFGIWIGLATVLNRLSEEQDRTGDPAIALKLQRVSAPGLILYAATTFFASVDWIMSLTPHWSSSIFGILFMVGQGVTTMAMVLAVLRRVAGRGPLSEEAGPLVLRDLGNLLFMFLMLWAYASFSQLIIIWSGNLPEEIPWYLSRLHTSWKFLSLAILLLYFAVPFGLLLSRRVKQSLETAAAVAGAVLFMRLVEVIWLVEPTFHPKGLFVHWMDFAAPLGLAGIWTADFFRELSRRPILALHDARVPEAARHG
jgi:hypothetical protein